MRILKENNGFTLIEVVASIVIVTIVLTSFATLIIQSNKTAVYNNEKLVLIHLADAELERLQAIPIQSNYSTLQDYLDMNHKRIYELNSQFYLIDFEVITPPSGSNELSFQLANVLTTVSLCKNKSNVTIENCEQGAKSSTEGYVSFEENK
ncbi:type II secretion system protein [Lysinibacillus fusiformis]|nr:type II secretion system protein [Lysinibacillus fusiformis]